MKKTFLFGMTMVMVASAAFAGNGQVGSVGTPVDATDTTLDIK